MKNRRLSVDNRGVSTSFGFILIVAIVIFSTAIIVAVGAATISESQQVAEREAAEQAMTQLDAKMSLVAFEGGDKQVLNLGATNHEQVYVEDGGQIRIELRMVDDQDLTNYTVEEVLLEEDLGSIVYDMDDYEVAYQGGAVFSMADDDVNRTSLVSAPEFSLNERTLTLPMVAVNPDSDFSAADGKITIESSETNGIFPVPQEDADALTNPVIEEDLVVEIQSDYYQAWADYFENWLGATPVFDHDNNKVTLYILNPGEEGTIDDAIMTSGASEEIVVAGGGDALIDSYDSREGSYDVSQGENATFMANVGIDIRGTIEIYGDVFTGGDLSLSGAATIHYDAYVEGAIDNPDNIEGDIHSEANVDSAIPIDTVIEEIRNDLQSANDNNDVPEITGNTLDTSTNPTLEEGSYLLDDLVIESGETLTLDISDGSIDILVEDSLEVYGTIEVVGADIEEDDERRANIYIRPDGGDRGEMIFDSQGGDDIAVTVNDDQSPAMWFYGPADTSIQVGGHTELTGVLYAPSTPSADGEATFNQHSQLYGALVSGDVTLDTNVAIHYDEALREIQTFTDEHHVEQVSERVSYFHFSITQVEAE